MRFVLSVITIVPTPMQGVSHACSHPLPGFVLQGMMEPAGSVEWAGQGQGTMQGSSPTVGVACQGAGSSC